MRALGIMGLVILINTYQASVVANVADGAATMAAPGQTLLVRLPSNTLLKYTAYKDVSILHFRVPQDTRTAMFSFKAYEESKSAFQRVCPDRDVTLHLKAGSYPVISPENITFPRHFLSADQRFEIYDLQFKSDSTTKRLNVEGPQPGNWFAVAFISWTDPNNDRIEQQGLSPTCETLLLSEMSVIEVNTQLLSENVAQQDVLLTNSSTPLTYKFFVPRDVVSITLQVTITKACPECPEICLDANAQALPSVHSYIHTDTIWVNESATEFLQFHVQENEWHYVDLSFSDSGNSSQENPDTPVYEVEFTIMIEFHTTEIPLPPDLKAVTFDTYPLLRQTYREFFMFDYDLLPDINGTVPASLNLTTGTPALFKFEVGDVYDIGGTLSFAISMKQDIRGNPVDQGAVLSVTESAPLFAQKLVDTSAEDAAKVTNGARSNQTIIICMHLGVPGIPTWPDHCVYGRHVFPAAIIVNNTDADTSTGLVHVPFPESGSWFVTLGLFCHGAETAARTTIIDSVKEFVKIHKDLLSQMQAPCACSERRDFYRNCLLDETCLAELNETETLKIKECLMDAKCTPKYQEMSRQFELHHKFATEQIVIDNASCNASVLFTISSSPCVAGRCGRYGRCYHYMSGGFVFSTCLCIKGYRGWDCTEDSQVPSSMSILLASLLLTLSNLLFIPSIYFAIRRKYYTEAVIYFFAMFFSTFYHACDSGEDEYSFCLVKIGVLQFCDFYCGLLAIWVTLIAMAHVRQTFVSLLHMLGAILLAFGTELNKQSLWVFLAPALTGICLISASWGLRCRKTRKWFPARNYLVLYMPIGAVLVMVGLVCYAFLQTRQNYHIVHSVWHMVMALSILCLLPNRKTFLPKC
uniref:EGF-like domain-containing protein n=1 Tax=Phlebotomus kandelakii TaxID=1109342 RepID=A0A6B2E627_9DIPT